MSIYTLIDGTSFEEAIQIDPNYAQAYSALSRSYYRLVLPIGVLPAPETMPIGIGREPKKNLNWPWNSIRVLTRRIVGTPYSCR